MWTNGRRTDAGVTGEACIGSRGYRIFAILLSGI